MSYVRSLLVIDDPNLDMSLSDLLQERPTRDTRPDMAVLLRWFRQQDETGNAIASIFTNVSHHYTSADKKTGWMRGRLRDGYNVFVQRKDANEHGDIDDKMLDFLMTETAHGRCNIYVLSHDARNFLEPLKRLEAAGHRVRLLGFRELLNGYHGVFDYIDLEQIDGLFPQPLKKPYDFDSISEQGTLFRAEGTPRMITASPPELPPPGKTEERSEQPMRPVPAPPRMRPPGTPGFVHQSSSPNRSVVDAASAVA